MLWIAGNSPNIIFFDAESNRDHKKNIQNKCKRLKKYIIPNFKQIYEKRVIMANDRHRREAAPGTFLWILFNPYRNYLTLKKCRVATPPKTQNCTKIKYLKDYTG